MKLIWCLTVTFLMKSCMWCKSTLTIMSHKSLLSASVYVLFPCDTETITPQNLEESWQASRKCTTLYTKLHNETIIAFKNTGLFFSWLTCDLVTLTCTCTELCSFLWSSAVAESSETSLLAVAFDQLHGPLTRYAKLRVAHAPRMPGTFSPPPTLKETAS